MTNLNYLIDQYIFKKKDGGKTDNPSIKIYVSKTENRTTFKIKTGYYLELLIPEKMKNITHLEITEVILVHFNIVNNYYQQDSRVLCTFVPNKTFGSLSQILPTSFIFLKTFN